MDGDEHAEPPRQQPQLDRRAVEAWFRRRGLPLVVRQDRRGSALLQRAIPALVFLLTVDPLLSLLAVLVDLPAGELERLLDNPALVVGQLVVVAVAALVLPTVLAWLATRWLRALDPAGRRALAVVVLVLNVLVLPVVDWVVGLRTYLWVSLAINVGATVVVLFAVYVGAGSILAWGLRHALRQLGTVGTMATRALPLLVLVVMFAFFSTEMWQIADALPRPQLWSVVALLAGLSVLFMIATQADELRAMTDRASSGRVDLAGQLRDTPLRDLVTGDEPVRPQPLSRAERVNVTLVLFVAQALQIAVLALLVFVLFVVFGTLAIRESVVRDWLGGGELQEGRLFGVELPVSRALVQVSIFLSVFSGLYFTASAATDPHYRKAFFDPLLAEVRVSLAVRQVYLARRADASYPGKQTVTDR
jgi:hypothetical protein